MRSVLLALSTFRYSKSVVERALEEAGKGRPLVIVYIVDANLARYFIGTDVGFYPDLMKKTEQELLKEYETAAEKRVCLISREAEAQGINVRTRVAVGRFAQECLAVAEAEKPGLIVTTRSKRPAWVRRFFGSPVDHLIKHAGCPVLEA